MLPSFLTLFTLTGLANIQTVLTVLFRMAAVKKKKKQVLKTVKESISLKGLYLLQNPLLLELVHKNSHMGGEKTQPSSL